MGITEIVLLVIGGLFFVISFFLPDGKKEEKITEEQIKTLVDKEIEGAKSKIDDMVEETVTYAVEKTERSLEKISNEKIMAIDEYSESVLKKINDNHNEAVFLYDMLNDKDERIKNSQDEISASIEIVETAKKEIAETKKEIVKEKEELEKSRSEEKSEPVKAEAVKDTSSFEPFTTGNLEVVELPSDFWSDIPTVTEPAPLEEKPKKKTSKSKTSDNKAAETKTQTTASKKVQPVSVHIESDNDGRKNSNEMIRKLHEEGKSNMQIARELNLGVGEVKLVIDLFANRK